MHKMEKTSSSLNWFKICFVYLWCAFLSGDLPFLYFPRRYHLFCTCTRTLSLPSLRERKTHPHPNGFPLDRRNRERILFTTSWAHLSFPQKIRCGIFKYVPVISFTFFQCLSIFYTTLTKNCLGLKIQKNSIFLQAITGQGRWKIC